MTPEEIKARVEELKSYEHALTILGNEFWEEKTRLRDDYKRITGEEI